MDSEIPQSTAWYDFLGWLDTHRTQIIRAVVGIALVALVISFWIWRSNEKEDAAASALVTLQMEALRSAGSRGENLRQFAAAHESTQAGVNALLLAGSALFTEGKYSEARNCFERYLARTSDSPFAVQANYGIAATLEADGKLPEALARYESIARLTREPLAERAKLAAARIQLGLKRPEEALKLYRQLAGNGSSAQAEAQLRATELLKQHPELAPTNAPSFAPANALVTPANELATPTNILATLTNLETPAPTQQK